VRYQLKLGDCIELMRAGKAESVDAIVCDPPYALQFMGKEWDKHKTPLDFQRWCEAWSREALRVLKPGGHAVVFGGTRTFHRMTCGLEDAGFEIRDCLSWMYGSGFPKSLNLDGEWHGWGTALKPAWEPIILARKPLTGTVAKNVLVHGTGALNIDGSRIATDNTYSYPNEAGGNTFTVGSPPDGSRTNPVESSPLGRWPANVVLGPEAAAQLDEQSGVSRDGVAVLRNRPIEGSGYNATSYEIKHKLSPDQGYGGMGGASRFFYCAKTSTAERNAGLEGFEPQWAPTMGGGIGGKPHDEDIATPKVNVHPTVKPIELMRWLVRLVTPPGGLVLDPFVGSGTTGCAAALEDFNFVGFDREQEYLDIAAARIAWWQEHASAEPAKSILAAAKKEVKR
jgi:site-specific DNA-methyltransferase (adenine-specific)